MKPRADKSTFLLVVMFFAGRLPRAICYGHAFVVGVASRIGSWVAGYSKEVATKFLSAVLSFCFISLQCLRLFLRRVFHCSYLALRLSMFLFPLLEFFLLVEFSSFFMTACWRTF